MRKFRQMKVLCAIMLTCIISISMVFVAGAAETPVVTSFEKHFVQNEFMGAWEEGTDKVMKVKTAASNVGTANSTAIKTKFGNAIASEFTLTFDVKMGGGEGAGFFYNTGSFVGNPESFSAFHYRKNLATHTSDFAPINMIIDGVTITDGDWLNITITLKDGTLISNAKKGGVNAFDDITKTGITFDSALEFGFFVTKTEQAKVGNTGFKNIVMKGVVSGAERVFRAFPFDNDFVDYPELGEYKEKNQLNNNMILLDGYGNWAETYKVDELKAISSSGGGLGERAQLVSNFGGEYRESFELMFDTTVPADTNDTDNGFFFRTPDVVDNYYNGVLVRVNHSNIEMIYQGEADEAGKKLKELTVHFKKSAVKKGDWVTVKVIAKAQAIEVYVLEQGTADSILVDVAADANKTETKKEKAAFSTTAKHTLSEVNAATGSKLTYAGFYADKAYPAKFKNIKMTSEGGAADFTAYPFGKKVIETYKLSSETAKNFDNTADAKDGVDLTDKDSKLNTDPNKGFVDTGLDAAGFTRLFYFHYNGLAQSIVANTAAGETVPVGYTLKMYNGAMLAEYKNDAKDANRYGLVAVVYDNNGYVVFQEKFVINILKRELKISGIKATNRTYNATNTIVLTGGKIDSGVVGTENISLNLGEGTMKDANVGTDKAVDTKIGVKGSGNYYIIQPTDIKVTIAKGKFDAPDAPEIDTVATTSVVLMVLEGDSSLEFSKDGETWQASNMFDNLKPNTSYTFYSRLKATSNTEASDASESFTIKTKEVAVVKEEGCGASTGASAGLLGGLMVCMGLAVVVSRKKRKI